MKIHFTIIILFITAEFSSAQASTASQNDNPRHFYQNQFIRIFLSERSITPADVASFVDLDSLFHALEKAWLLQIEKAPVKSIPLEALRNLDSYAYYMTLISTRYPPPIDLECHCWDKFMIPALERDLAFLIKDATPNYSGILWPGVVNNTIGLIAKCQLRKSQLNRVTSLYKETTAILNRFQKTVSDEKRLTSVRNMLQELRSFEATYTLYELMSENRLDEAFSKLTVELSLRSWPSKYFVNPGKMLATRFHEAQKDQYARAILQMMGEKISNSDLPADSLKAWHSMLGFDDLSLSRNTGLRDYKEGPDIGVLQGKYYDLQHERYIDLDKTHGKYIIFDFWHTACKPCIEDVPALNEFYNSIKNDTSYIFLSVNTDNIETKRDMKFVKKFMKEKSVGYPVIWDIDRESLKAKFQIIGYPTIKIINPNGRVMQKIDGSEPKIPSIREFVDQLRTK